MRMFNCSICKSTCMVDNDDKATECSDCEVRLEPCPFCGEDDLKIFHNGPNYNITRGTMGYETWFISCRGDCFFAGPPSCKSQDDAINRWNRRDND